MVKIILSRTVCDTYLTDIMAANEGQLELIVTKMKAVEVYAESISGAMTAILKYSGKASWRSVRVRLDIWQNEAQV